MKKVALVFVVAVFVPSLVLAWLAVRSLRDQQFVVERQQSLLCQGATDALAGQVNSFLSDRQHDFALQIEQMLADKPVSEVASGFDNRLRTNWPLAEVGFVVTKSGDLVSPVLNGRKEAKEFLGANGQFLNNRESAEVYWTNVFINANPAPAVQEKSLSDAYQKQASSLWGRRDASREWAPPAANAPASSTRSGSPQVSQGSSDADITVVTVSNTFPSSSALNLVANNAGMNNLAVSNLDYNNGGQNVWADQLRKGKVAQSGNVRRVVPQQQAQQFEETKDKQEMQAPNMKMIQLPVVDGNYSKIAPAEAEFQQLVGDATDGTVARFVNNKLNVLFWHRSPRDPNYIFGAQLALPRLVGELRGLVQNAEYALRGEMCVALLNDSARPEVVSQPDFQANWKRPFVSSEISEALPHWEVAAYLVNPARLTQSAHTLKLTLGLLIAVLLLAIGVGSWLIVSDLNRQLRLARQKTDFVSNVSHELKTPLTSIRMFSELLAGQRVSDPAKQRSYLNIITAETARLTRLINNVLDFSRMESGEKKYNFREADLVQLVRDTVETYRPHLENNGFKFECMLPESALVVRGDPDALSQVIVNLLSNAEKYSSEHKEIRVEVVRCDSPSAAVEIRVLDRGLGVPHESREKIFEKFYRAHDSLASGIQGSGLGLTLARQIARAHSGDVGYEPREGGGSCFRLRLPLLDASAGRLSPA